MTDVDVATTSKIECVVERRIQDTGVRIRHSADFTRGEADFPVCGKRCFDDLHEDYLVSVSIDCTIDERL